MKLCSLPGFPRYPSVYRIWVVSGQASSMYACHHVRSASCSSGTDRASAVMTIPTWQPLFHNIKPHLVPSIFHRLSPLFATESHLLPIFRTHQPRRARLARLPPTSWPDRQRSRRSPRSLARRGRDKTVSCHNNHLISTSVKMPSVTTTNPQTPSRSVIQ